MEALKIKGGLDTPMIDFDANTGILEIAGKSYPSDATAFYAPIFDWVDKYAAQPAEKTEVRIKLDYFNTASSKVLLDLLYKFKKIYEQGNDLIVKWYYPDDDEDMEETGYEYAEILKIPFEHIGYTVLFK